MAKKDAHKDIMDAICSAVKKEIKSNRKDKDGKDIWKATGETCRLVHDGKAVISLIEGTAWDVTTSKNSVFVGTRKQCESEIKRIDLK